MIVGRIYNRSVQNAVSFSFSVLERQISVNDHASTVSDHTLRLGNGELSADGLLLLVVVVVKEQDQHRLPPVSVLLRSAEARLRRCEHLNAIAPVAIEKSAV